MGSDERAAYTSGSPHHHRAPRRPCDRAASSPGWRRITFTSLISSGDPSQGTTYTLIAVTAMVLGGTALAGGRGGVMGSLLGAVNIYLITYVLATFNFGAVQSFVTDLAYGTILVLSLLLTLVLPFIRGTCATSRRCCSSSCCRWWRSASSSTRPTTTSPPAPKAAQEQAEAGAPVSRIAGRCARRADAGRTARGATERFHIRAPASALPRRASALAKPVTLAALLVLILRHAARSVSQAGRRAPGAAGPMWSSRRSSSCASHIITGNGGP